MTAHDLRAVRHRLGLSQKAFAREIDISQSYLADMERGHKPVTREMAARVLALVTVPAGLCGTCLCVIAGGMCGCPVREAALMAETCTVDAELFDSLQAAIDFVAGCGGGIVYTELAETIYAKAMKVPPTVKLEAKRPVAA